MSFKTKFSDTFTLLFKDRRIFFLFLATLLIAFSYISTVYIDIFDKTIQHMLLTNIPFSFAWVIIAWITTDKSVLRRPLPYISVFFLFFLETSIVYYPYLTNFNDFSTNLDLTYTISIAQMIIKLLALFAVFIIFWRLIHPKDFKTSDKSFWKNKKTGLLFLSSFLITLGFWIWFLLDFILRDTFYSFILDNLWIIEWMGLLFYGIPLFFAWIIFAVVITKIECKFKYVLYGTIGFFTLLPYLLIYPLFQVWTIGQNIIIALYTVSYFFIFLSILLLTKKKYIDY